MVLAAALVLAPMMATAQSPNPPQVPRDDYSAGQMAADILLGRPLGFVATVVGAALFVVSFPLSVAGGNMEEARQRLVIDPAEFTFKRPLGEF
jgi:hypothetical protein